MKVIVQLVDVVEYDWGKTLILLGEGQLELAKASEEGIRSNSTYKINLECDRAVNLAARRLLVELMPEVREIRRKLQNDQAFKVQPGWHDDGTDGSSSLGS